MKKGNRNKIFKVMLVLLDIIAVVILVLVTVKWFNNKKNNPIDNYQTVRFKKFTFNIDNKLKYQKLDEYKFSLENDDYQAVIEIYLNDNNFTFGDTELFYKTIQEDGYVVGEYSDSMLLDNYVLIFKDYNNDKNSYLCYFETNDSYYAVQVELKNKNNSLSVNDNLESIMKIFKDAKYDYDSDEIYYYRRFIPNDNG